jgi:hypothetical protein
MVTKVVAEDGWIPLSNMSLNTVSPPNLTIHIPEEIKPVRNRIPHTESLDSLTSQQVTVPPSKMLQVQDQSPLQLMPQNGNSMVYNLLK